MDKLVLIEKESAYKLNSLSELVEVLLDKNYNTLSQEEQRELLKRRAFENEIVNKFEQGTINLTDEIAYILSLIKCNLITIVEKKDAEILAKYMDKTQIYENYIILNVFADTLLKNYLLCKN